MTLSRWLGVLLLCSSLVIGACAGEHDGDDDGIKAGAMLASRDVGHDNDHDDRRAARDKDDDDTAVPVPTGRIIEIQLMSDEQGNRFEPAKVEAHPGDVLRFTLTSGVHNISFTPQSNEGKAKLPPASEMLQLPGQTLDIPVNFAPGHYSFQCDPHALLGMLGTLEVEAHD
jgi:plastocyanin